MKKIINTVEVCVNPRRKNWYEKAQKQLDSKVGNRQRQPESEQISIMEGPGGSKGYMAIDTVLYSSLKKKNKP